MVCPAPSGGASGSAVIQSGTKCIVWGMQAAFGAKLLALDFVGNHNQKYYWGHNEILIPVYKQMSDAMRKHPDASVMVNFASLRSAYDSTLEALQFPQIRRGHPGEFESPFARCERLRNLSRVIGPATRRWHQARLPSRSATRGGMMDNILKLKLYRPGPAGLRVRSGGMSNELNNIIALNADGVLEGLVVKRRNGRIAGPARRPDHQTNGAWLHRHPRSGSESVQFGHAGACANSGQETASAKNAALAAAGAHVPASFDQLGETIRHLVGRGVIVPKEEPAPPTVPMDYSWARELGLIRKPSSFMTSICDERGQELLYAGVPITEIINRDFGIGGYACKFIEMCLIITADHGPAVSGAHNTIVCARAGKDLVSCLTSGLLTIGDRFGGALDGAAAKQFSHGVDTGLIPMEFVNEMRKRGELIMGIGHRVKSINNPDMRVEILKKFALENFPASPMLHYALEVEKITTSKKPNLILNVVDGMIGVAMEADEFIEIGALNGMFVLGRSMGFIGHYLDQRRLKQGLYRHPWDDISYVMPEQSQWAP
uniref:ATP citrate synthase n=1 Tax=Macrostomum lignano TaxID=282301 RepID=A0A1I8FMY2_9PLAT